MLRNSTAQATCHHICEGRLCQRRVLKLQNLQRPSTNTAAGVRMKLKGLVACKGFVLPMIRTLGVLYGLEFL